MTALQSPALIHAWILKPQADGSYISRCRAEWRANGKLTERGFPTCPVCRSQVYGANGGDVTRARGTGGRKAVRG